MREISARARLRFRHTMGGGAHCERHLITRKFARTEPRWAAVAVAVAKLPSRVIRLTGPRGKWREEKKRRELLSQI